MSQAHIIEQQVFQRCEEWLYGQQQQIEEAYQISQCQWELSLSHGRITYFQQRQVVAEAQIVMLGSYHLRKGTWVWAWANPSFAACHTITPAQVSGLTRAMGWGWLATSVVPVFQRPALWRDQVTSPSQDHINRTAVARLVSMAAYQVGGSGVHFARQRDVLACTALTHVYRPVG
jgi:hypothetical protein